MAFASEPPVTLVTYTYNDFELVRGLLRQTTAWTRQPDRIIVVDDGSDTPYSPENDLPQHAVLRLASNIGPAGAKENGISSVTDGLVMSVDCDIRFDPGWLQAALPCVLEPEVGLVGPGMVFDAGSDAASRHQRLFSPDFGATDNADFIRGGVWLMRSSIWEEMDGFSGHSGPILEDYHFSRKLRMAGYRLIIPDAPAVRSVRRLGRSALARQNCVYMGPSLASLLHNKGITAGVDFLANDTCKRLGLILDSRDIALVHVELLLLAAMVLEVSEKDELYRARDTLTGFFTAMDSLLVPYPRLAGLMRADVAGTGRLWPRTKGDIAPWGNLMSELDVLGHSGILTWLNTSGVDGMLSEDTDQTYDFHYLGCP